MLRPDVNGSRPGIRRESAVRRSRRPYEPDWVLHLSRAATDAPNGEGTLEAGRQTGTRQRSSTPRPRRTAPVKRAPSTATDRTCSRIVISTAGSGPQAKALLMNSQPVDWNHVATLIAVVAIVAILGHYNPWTVPPVLYAMRGDDSPAWDALRRLLRDGPPG